MPWSLFSHRTPPNPPPVEPPSALTRVRVTAEKALLHEKTGTDGAGKPILEIWHDENGKVARFDPGTIFSVSPEPVFADRDDQVLAALLQTPVLHLG